MTDFLDAQNEAMVQIDYEKPDHKRFPDYLDLKRRGFSDKVQDLLRPFETGVEPSLHNQIRQCERVLDAIRLDTEIAKDLARALGFDQLVKNGKFDAKLEEERILGKFGNLVEGKAGAHYPTPLAMVIGVVSNGLPREKAEVVIDEIARSRTTQRTPTFPKDENELQWAFRSTSLDLLSKRAYAPEWVADKFAKMPFQ